jgi:hypothetical protein
MLTNVPWLSTVSPYADFQSLATSFFAWLKRSSLCSGTATADIIVDAPVIKIMDVQAPTTTTRPISEKLVRCGRFMNSLVRARDFRSSIGAPMRKEGRKEDRAILGGHPPSRGAVDYDPGEAQSMRFGGRPSPKRSGGLRLEPRIHSSLMSPQGGARTEVGGSKLEPRMRSPPMSRQRSGGMEGNNGSRVEPRMRSPPMSRQRSGGMEENNARTKLRKRSFLMSQSPIRKASACTERSGSRSEPRRRALLMSRPSVKNAAVSACTEEGVSQFKLPLDELAMGKKCGLQQCQPRK